MQSIKLLIITIFFSNILLSQDRFVTEDSVLIGDLIKTESNIFLIGEMHNNSFPNQQFEIIKFLYYHKGVNKIGLELESIEEKYILDYVLYGDEYFFKIHDKNYASKEKFELLKLIREFNKHLTSNQEKLTVFCFDVTLKKPKEYFELFQISYFNHISKNNKLHHFFRQIENKEKSWKDKKLEFIQLTNNITDSEIKKIFGEDSIQAWRDIRGYALTGSLFDDIYKTFEIREKFLFESIFKSIRDTAEQFLIITGADHINKCFSSSEDYPSYTSKIVNENYDVFCMLSIPIIKEPFFKIFYDQESYLYTLVNENPQKMFNKRAPRYLLFNGEILLKKNMTHFCCDFIIYYNGIKWRRKLF